MKKAMTNSGIQLNYSGPMSKRVREGLLIIFVSLALYILVALMTHHVEDPGWSQTGSSNDIMNLAGKTGAWFSDVLFFIFGYIAYCLPPIVAFIGVLIYKPIAKVSTSLMDVKLSVWCFRTVGVLLTVLTSCGLSSMHYSYNTAALPMTSGGLLGMVVKTGLVNQLSHVGATIILLAFFLASITLFTGLSWLKLTDLLGHYSWRAMVRMKEEAPGLSRKALMYFNLFMQKAKILVLKLKRPKKFAVPVVRTELIDKDAFDDVFSFRAAMDRKAAYKAPVITQDFQKPIEPVTPVQSFAKSFAQSFTKAITRSADIKSTVSSLPPSLGLLDAAEPRSEVQGFNKAELDNLSVLVEKRLTEFGVQAKVMAVYPGPVVTRFELDLAAGIKVSKISGLSKDLARSLSVMSVRVVEVIPGKSYIGVEIPNEKRELVRLKDVLASSGYQGADSPLTLGLGKDISGRPVSVDLAKMPHLLVAGTTGSGKSVGINAMILSILYKATPDEVRMILIDPKMLELSVYDKIPHLLTPVVTDMKDAASSLRWCVSEMESRYQLMAALGVRNLAGYNQKIEEAEQNNEAICDPLWEPNFGGEPSILTKKPYIVVIVDEFADLIMVVGKQVEELIARIAQKARAAGIHLILATQRPSVDVITGLIKANIPTRIAFQVSCRIDSRTILDQSGAEQLLGHGDMLYLAPGTGIPQRIHGAFVSDEEVHKVANQWRKQGAPDYVDNILRNTGSIPGFDSPKGGDEYDELYDEAVKIVTETRRPSISHVQRRLRIGYNRAATLIEQMERDGILSPMQSNGTREVLAPPPVER